MADPPLMMPNGSRSLMVTGIVEKLADEFNAIFVPYQAAFDAALKLAPARYWGADGVHPDYRAVS